MFAYPERNIKDNWIEIHTFEIDDIASNDGISGFISSIDQAIAAASGSLLTSML
ncbi:hypothetical protein QQY79_04150 [Flavobacterium tructae]|uniref:hypothetical protein n=1 Tax=Flavobacterium tructae TaxID=1114873 RepID=UPI002551F17C|nr:hypothetical protein [Flavobacterium tructae]MDL2141701.1 hypothetical protein [Flavobacterium tructae]